MAKKLTVVSKTITSMTEPWCDTSAGTCHDFLDVEEFLKAKLNETATAISNKADTTAIADLETTLNDKLSSKADLSTVSTAISNKADKSAVTALENTVSQKADSADVDTALAKKANSTDVTSALAKKADVSALDLKANKSDVISREELNTKADKSEVVSKSDLALKADKAELDTKAGVFYNDEERNRVLVFADESSRDAYLANTSNVDLVLGVINASSGSGGGGGEADYSSLIAAWKTNPGCSVEEVTGLLTLSILMDGVDYGFKDITISEAALMLQRQGRGGNWNGLCYGISRINLPPINYPNPIVQTTNLFCSYNGSIQTLMCTNSATNFASIGDLSHIGGNCPNLRAVIGRINNTGGTMSNAGKLEEIRIASVGGNSISIPDSPLLSYASIEYFVTTQSAKAITFTVHADVYAKLTGDTNNAACAALTEEERQKWAALLVTATSKQITFTTA